MKNRSDKKVDHYIFCRRTKLGTGPYGEVYKGKDLQNNLPVAVKVIPLLRFPSDYMQNYLATEIPFLKALNHENIVKTYDVFFTQRNVYIFSEYCSKGSLRTLFNTDGLLNFDQTSRLLKNILAGLQYLNSKTIIHRDLKPENILICEDNSAKIADFGIMKNILPLKGHFPLYLAPQILKEEIYTEKSDIFSLGLIIYEGIYGKLPEARKKEIKFPFNIEVQSEIKLFIKGCLELEEGERIDLEQARKILKSLESNETNKKHGGEKEESIRNEEDEILRGIALGLQWKFEANKKELDKIFNFSEERNVEIDVFKKIMGIIDDKMEEPAIEFLFERVKDVKTGLINLKQFKQFITEQDFTHYDIKKDPFLEEKVGRIIYCLKEVIKRNKLNVDDIFNKFNKKESATLDQECFFELTLAINPFITKIESNYLFKKLDYDNSGDISANEFKGYILKDSATARKIHSLEEKFKQISYGLKNLVIRQKVEINKIFKNYEENESGKLDKEGFGNILRILDKKIADDEINHIFLKLDRERKNWLSLREFSCLIKNF